MNRRNKIFYSLRGRRLEQVTVLVLLALLILFQLAPKRFGRKHPELAPVMVDFTIESIPATRQMLRRGSPRPPKPKVPIPVEELEFPEDATIDAEAFKWQWLGSPLGNAGITAGKADTLPPRPILQVMPEYPEELRNKKLSGSVKLLVRIGSDGSVLDVVVADNSTGSELFEKMAINAASRSSFAPAKSQNKNIEMWTTCIYSFRPR